MSDENEYIVVTGPKGKKIKFPKNKITRVEPGTAYGANELTESGAKPREDFNLPPEGGLQSTPTLGQRKR